MDSANNSPSPALSPGATAIEVCKQLDEFQRTYEANAYSPMPGNSLYSAKLMAIVAAARNALATAPGAERIEAPPDEQEARVDGVPEGAHGDLPRHTTR